MDYSQDQNQGMQGGGQPVDPNANGQAAQGGGFISGFGGDMGQGGFQPAAGQPAAATPVAPAEPVMQTPPPVAPVAPAEPVMQTPPPVAPVVEPVMQTPPPVAPVAPAEPVMQTPPPAAPAASAPVTPPASGGAGDYVFGQIWDGFDTNIKLPPHQLQFDETQFLRLLAGSISLTKEEKWKIIQYVPKLTQYKVEQLMKILEEEQRKFQELSVEHGEHLQKLEEKHASEWKDLEYKFDQKNQRDEDSGKADDIRKSLGI